MYSSSFLSITSNTLSYSFSVEVDDDSIINQLKKIIYYKINYIENNERNIHDTDNNTILVHLYGCRKGEGEGKKNEIV